MTCSLRSIVLAIIEFKVNITMMAAVIVNHKSHPINIKFDWLDVQIHPDPIGLCIHDSKSDDTCVGKQDLIHSQSRNDTNKIIVDPFVLIFVSNLIIQYFSLTSISQTDTSLLKHMITVTAQLVFRHARVEGGVLDQWHCQIEICWTDQQTFIIHKMMDGLRF